MGKVRVVNHVTLDGVMQAPGGPDEDIRDGFAHGGWAFARSDEVMEAKLAEHMARGRAAGERGGLLFGRWTYEKFYSVWPNRTDNPYTEVLNNTAKYVASRTLEEPLPWSNSSLLKGDVDDAVAELKQELPGGLTILGSGELVASLMAADLIDEYLLMIHPLVVGAGRRLFPPGVAASLRLVESVPTTTGVLITTYESARTRTERT
jgi:dihydrofolate reductase